MQTNIDRVSAESKPWLSLRLVQGQAQIEGHPRCSLGRRVPVTGQPDDDGVFLQWEWDGRRLSVQNDRYGLYPLFYCARGDSICVSPSLEHVVRGNSQRVLNWSALAVFHRLGHFVGDDTPFEDVHFLPPNTTLSWADGRLELSTGPIHLGRAIDAGASFDDTVDRYVALFAQAIARRLPDSDAFAVPISGGRDSRHILLELAKQGHVPQSCLTVKYRPPATNEDTRIARLLTQRLGIRHVEIEKPDSFFQATLKDVHLTNHCGGGHGWVLPVASHLAGDVSTSYDGLAGEVVSAGFLQSPEKAKLFRAQRLDDLAHLLLSEGRGEALRHVLSADVCSSIPLGLAVRRMTAELERHADQPNPVRSFVFWNRTRRCVASIPFSIMHQVSNVHVPYLDHELFDFLFALDASVVDGNRLHDETIRRAYPEFADIPFEDKRMRAVFRPDERDYYRQARWELFAYLRSTPAELRRVVQSPYLYAKIGADLLTGKIDPAWYMRTALQAIELERLRTSA